MNAPVSIWFREFKGKTFERENTTVTAYETALQILTVGLKTGATWVSLHAGKYHLKKV